MLVQNLKLVVRTLQKRKFYALSTIIGFASALVLFTLILSTIIYEYDTDRFHDDNVYRVKMLNPFGSEMDIITFHELPTRLRSDFPEIEFVTHLYYPGYRSFYSAHNNEKIRHVEKKVFYADEFFFKVFNYRLKYGDVSTSLTEPRSVVITAERALTYFGSSDVLNQSIEFDNELYKITGVLENPIANSHLDFDFLLSNNSLPPGKNRLDYGGFTYFSLVYSSDLNNLVDKLNKQSSTLFTSTRTQANPAEKTFDIESIYSCYFNTEYSNQYLSVVNKTRDKKTLTFFFIIASAILSVAVINFLIFYFSRILFATKDVGVKRALGISDLWALTYFVLEAFVILSMSLLLAIAISVVIFPYINVWLSASVPKMFLLDFRIVLTLLSGIVFLSVLFGWISFRSIYRINTVRLLKESSSFVSTRSSVIYVVMAIQILFSASVILSFFSLENQMRFTQQQPLGYQIDNLIEIDLSGLSPSYNPHDLKSAFRQNANVSSVSICMGGPFSGRGQRDMEFDGQQVNMSYYNVDEDFISTLGMKVISGENFDGNTIADSSYLLINESAATFFKYDEITRSFELPPGVTGEVTGVIEDFHYSSFRGMISPVFISYARFEKLGNLGKLIVRLNSITPEALASIKGVWLKTVGDVPFDYTVLANDYSDFYTSDRNEMRLMSFAAIVTLLITCLGIVGMSYYLSGRRLKEFSIRRVFGASSSRIYFDWMKGLMVTVMFSFTLSIPISFFLTQRWFEGFAYKAPLSISPAITTLTLMTLAVFTSSFYNMYAVMKKNPTEILRQD